MDAKKTYYVAHDGSDTNPGTFEQPWATIGHAAELLKAGETVFVRGGTYHITSAIRPVNSGTFYAPIVYSGYRDEEAVIDAHDMPPFEIIDGRRHFLNEAAFWLKDVSCIEVRNLKFMNSHYQGITMRDSSYIDVINCTTQNTFSCGIAMWDTVHDALHCHHNRVLGNTVIKATTWDMIPDGMTRGHEPPHEAISIAGGTDFEVAWNHVYNCDKEGIDVKEVSRRGKVHHNYVHHVDRQGLYADAWFGLLEDVEFCDNIVESCHGAGVAVSVEGRDSNLLNLSVHNNLVFGCDGPGLIFARWGHDRLRKHVKIFNNTFAHNGCGKPWPGQDYFWITGGAYLFSANLEDVDIYNNIFSDNRNFEIGYSDHYEADEGSIADVLRNKGVRIRYNLLNDTNTLKYPIYAGWQDNYSNIRPYRGECTVEGDPCFIDPAKGDYRLAEGSSAIGTGCTIESKDTGCCSGDDRRDGCVSRSGGKSDSRIDGKIDDRSNSCSNGKKADIGAFAYGSSEQKWWKDNFPPQI